MSRDPSYLLDIYQSAHIIREFTRDMDEQMFESDLKTQDAVIRRLAIIGEATKQLSDEFRAQHPEIPWKNMAGMRDILVHDYNRVNLERVWRVVEDEIPRILQQIKPLIPPDSAA